MWVNDLINSFKFKKSLSNARIHAECQYLYTSFAENLVKLLESPSSTDYDGFNIQFLSEMIIKHKSEILKYSGSLYPDMDEKSNFSGVHFYCVSFMNAIYKNENNLNVQGANFYTNKWQNRDLFSRALPCAPVIDSLKTPKHFEKTFIHLPRSRRKIANHVIAALLSKSCRRFDTTPFYGALLNDDFH